MESFKCQFVSQAIFRKDYTILLEEYQAMEKNRNDGNARNDFTVAN